MLPRASQPRQLVLVPCPCDLRAAVWLLTSWMAADRVLGMGGGSRIVVAHGFRKIHSLRHGDGDRCRLEMPTSASWLGAQTPSYAFGHSIGHRDLLTDNTSTRWAELWRPQGRSLRWMDGRGIIARSRTPVDHLKLACRGQAVTKCNDPNIGRLHRRRPNYSIWRQPCQIGRSRPSRSRASASPIGTPSTLTCAPARQTRCPGRPATRFRSGTPRGR